jgi:hypothetical protein
MKHSRFLPLLLAVAACGGIDSHEDAIEAQIEVMNDTAAVFRTIKDKKSAEAARSKLEALQKRSKEIETAMSKLEGEPDEKTKQKEMADMAKATSDLMAAAQGIPNDPEIHQVLGDLMR